MKETGGGGGSVQGCGSLQQLVPLVVFEAGLCGLDYVGGVYFDSVCACANGGGP